MGFVHGNGTGKEDKTEKPCCRICWASWIACMDMGWLQIFRPYVHGIGCTSLYTHGGSCWILCRFWLSLPLPNLPHIRGLIIMQWTLVLLEIGSWVLSSNASLHYYCFNLPSALWSSEASTKNISTAVMWIMETQSNLTFLLLLPRLIGCSYLLCISCEGLSEIELCMSLISFAFQRSWWGVSTHPVISW